MQVKKQQSELELEQQTGSKSGKEYVKAVYRHPAYLIYMQSSVQFSHSVVSDSATPWTAAYQALPSMGFPRQEYWSSAYKLNKHGDNIQP